MNTMPKPFRIFLKIILMFVLLEIGFRVEAYLLKPVYVSDHSKKSTKVLILGDCVSQNYPVHLKNFLAEKNINIDLYDDIIYHGLEYNTINDRKELISRLKPDLIISLNGLFEAHSRVAQHDPAAFQKDPSVLSKSKAYTFFKYTFHNYFTSDGKAKRLAQDYFSNNTNEKFQQLESFLLNNTDVFNDNYSRAVFLWLFNLSKHYPDREVANKKMELERIAVGNTIASIKEKIVLQSKEFDLKKFQYEKNQLIIGNSIYSSLLYGQQYDDYAKLVMMKPEDFGFSMLEALQARFVVKLKESPDKVIDLAEKLLLDLANNDDLPLNQLADKSCESDSKKYVSKLHCRLSEFDLSVVIAEHLEFLKNAKMTEEQNNKFKKIKEEYGVAMPAYNFENNKINFDYAPLGYKETKAYYDELVQFIKDNNYRLIIAQYPTFYLPFLKGYNSPEKDVYVFDTPVSIQSSEKMGEYLRSMQPSIYNSGRLTREGDVFLGNSIGSFIVEKKVLNK